MCGIAGVVVRGDGIVDRTQLGLIRDAMAHRGPDHAGMWVSHDGKVGLGHRRLSIIDLHERSNQPMGDAEEALWVVLNGEIYNYQPLREELGRKHGFRTSSDTEVILQAYREWGMVEALRRFRGFFAFCLYDREHQRVFLVRDRFGKKPLFYTDRENMLAFASEANALRFVLPLTPNEESLYHFLTLGTTFAPATFFHGVYKIPAGCYLEYDLRRGLLSEHRYYDIAEHLNAPGVSLDPVQESEASLEEAMRYRLVADVPVVVSLSGGLDSSLNAYYFRDYHPLCVNISWEGTNEFDESRKAQRVADSLALRLETLKVQPQRLPEILAEYLAIQRDVPLGDINTILIYLLSRHLRDKGIKACVVGEGGDELGGYSAYARSFTIQQMNRLPFAPLWAPLLRRGPEKLRRLVDGRSHGEVLPIHNLLGFREYQKRTFWNTGRTYDTNAKVASLMSEITHGTSPYDLYVRKISNIEYKLRLPELILARLDYPSMAASVEIRSPFMDHALIEQQSRISWDLRMKDRVPKYLLKEIAARHLPREAAYGPKVGFTHVFVPFLQHHLPRLFRTEVVAKDAPLKAYVKSGYLEWASRTLRDENLWRLYALNKWLELHA